MEDGGRTGVAAADLTGSKLTRTELAAGCGGDGDATTGLAALFKCTTRAASPKQRS